MSSKADYIQFVIGQLREYDNIRYRKMFGEYMVYIDDKPILLVCNNVVHIKKHECIANDMENADVSTPYNGAKEHYVLDVEDSDFAYAILGKLLEVTAVPKPKKKQVK